MQPGPEYLLPHSEEPVKFLCTRCVCVTVTGQESRETNDGICIPHSYMGTE